MITLQKISDDELNIITPWFDDNETIRYLGGVSFIKGLREREEKSVGKEFRDSKVLKRIGYVGKNESNELISYLECEIYDNYIGSKLNELSLKNKVTCSFIYTINPLYRNKGYGKQTVMSLINLPTLSDVKVFYATIDSGNDISEKILLKVGFKKVNLEKDGTTEWILVKPEVL